MQGIYFSLKKPVGRIWQLTRPGANSSLCVCVIGEETNPYGSPLVALNVGGDEIGSRVSGFGMKGARRDSDFKAMPANGEWK